ncbi:cyclic nucleotide-binding domain-containing protein [Nostoc sp.]|uniref:cyclic nucleotide-binding domain-containing protein n=1 Tax=Nostoc sp. TaxID=1180 RepID=UPI002FFC8BD8
MRNPDTVAPCKLVFSFLLQTSLFKHLDTGDLQWLASRLKLISVPADTILFMQGEVGEVCYLLYSGKLKVLTLDSSTLEQRQTTLEPNALVGEVALLTQASHEMTVQTLDPCQLFRLYYADLLKILAVNNKLFLQIVEMMHFRDRPRQHEGIIAHHRTTTTGKTFTVLKNPQCNSYFRLSPEGWLMWQHLDGQHNLQDLTITYLSVLKSFAPQKIAKIVDCLAISGFVERQEVHPEILKTLFRLQRKSQFSWWQYLSKKVPKLAESYIYLHQLDSLLTYFYRKGVRYLYTWYSQIILAAIVVAGLLSFIINSTDAVANVSVVQKTAIFLPFIIISSQIATLLHELGHAFTTKAFGRDVHRGGVGWYWFGPVFFVDTSDMWLAERWQQIAVSLAGPYTDLIVAGIVALTAWFMTSPLMSAMLWSFALLLYTKVVFNLNPLLKYDGYYVLADYIERPNLREEALSWMRWQAIDALKQPNQVKGHRVDLLYGCLSMLYVLWMVILLLIFRREFLRSLLSQYLSDDIASIITWVFFTVVVLIVIISTIAQIYNAPRPLTAGKRI